MKDAEILLKEIEQDLKKVMSEKRYQHSLHVMKKAEELAEKYHVDINKAKLVGLAHDIAKEISKEEKIKYVKEHHIEIDEFEKVNVELLHAKIGADVCREKYDFSEDMQEAIRCHTVGGTAMGNLAKIIFIADKTEEGRTYLDFDKVKEKEEEGLNDLLIYVIDISIKNMIDKGKIMHPGSIYTRNSLLLEKQKGN